MLRAFAFVFALFACGQSPEVEAASSADGASALRALPEELAALFERADRDPVQLAALIEVASRHIAAADGDTGHALAQRLEPHCRRAFFSPLRAAHLERLGVVTHRVAAGELPGSIARRHRIGPGLLGWLNEGYDERRLAVGAELKLLDLADAQLRLVVDRARHRVAAWRRAPSGGGWLLLAYVPVGLGADATPTPPGTTRVVERVLDPPWTDPNTNVTYAPDDPGNLLGGYWMRLDHEGLGRRGIGLHGFTGDDPSAWLGKNASNGCVRMLQDDMDRFFHLALEGTTVQIVP